MNILFFLTPKSEVAYIHQEDTVRQVMEKMEHHRFSCVPVIDKVGEYKGCITEGDVLWGLKNLSVENLKDTERLPVTCLKRKNDYRPVHVETDMEQLINRAMNQNFVPVVDDHNRFIGIITRKDILQYFYKKLSYPL